MDSQPSGSHEIDSNRARRRPNRGSWNPRRFQRGRARQPHGASRARDEDQSKQESSTAHQAENGENLIPANDRISSNEQPSTSGTNQQSHEVSWQKGGRGGRARRIRPTNYATNRGTNQIQTNFSRHQQILNNDDDHRQEQSALVDETSKTSNEVPSTIIVNNQSEIAERQLKTNNFECMICCDNISRYSPIWYCSSCYNIFHLKCAIEWCNKSIKSRNEAIANAQYPSLSQAPTAAPTIGINADSTQADSYSDYRSERMNSVEWPCPTCREILYSRPGKYKCFCGKVIRPEVNRHLTPHSCGQLCGRKRPNIDCPHNCNSICHPGRCAQCPLTSKRTCYCGQLTKDVKCSIGAFGCDNVCSKPLACGQHFCDKLCHSGSCKTCEETVTIKCHCGEQEMTEFCIDLNSKESSRVFSCEKMCGKLLDCKEHYCSKRCHPGPNCDSCKLLSQNIKYCPCGSTMIKKSLLAERKSCLNPIPTCENKCNKALICGPEKSRHRCQKKCHIGPCPPCKLKSAVQCECKLSNKTVDCSSMYEKIEIGQDKSNQVEFRQVEYVFSCESRCNKPKNCGKHRCNNKCCKFTKTKDLSIHKCDQTCNRKLPCNLHNCPEVCHQGQCGDCTNIGWEELRCHCGLSVLYPPIPCGARPPACHRPCRRAHDCGHPVKHECHDETEKCAPCTVFVRKSCFCGSESKDSVYCYLAGYSCGRTCKKLLKCRQHTCQRVCHVNDCETPNERGIIICKQSCPVIRFSCKHPCNIPCHGKVPCPATECRKLLTITCECGNKTDRLECYKVMKDQDNRNKIAMLSTNRSNQDSIIIDLSKSKPAQSSVNKTFDESLLKRLDCDESCSVLKRNKALAEALEITQPDLKPTSIFGEDPLRLLKEATVQDYKFVAATFNSLAKFVKTAKESEKRFIFMQFPPAEKLRREVVHELAYHFNCTSESDGDEPFRHVIVRAYKNKSCVPDFSIEQLLPVSD